MHTRTPLSVPASSDLEVKGAVHSVLLRAMDSRQVTSAPASTSSVIPVPYLVTFLRFTSIQHIPITVSTSRIAVAITHLVLLVDTVQEQNFHNLSVAPHRTNSVSRHSTKAKIIRKSSGARYLPYSPLKLKTGNKKLCARIATVLCA